MSFTYTDKNNLYSRCSNKHSQFRTFPSRVLMELSRIAFPMIVLLKDDRTNSFQEERLGLPYWTMILAICVLVDVSNYLDILIWGWCIFHSDLGISWYCVGCLSLRILVVLLQRPLLLLPSFMMLMILVQWILRKNLNHLSQCHLGVRLDLCIFETVVPTPNFWDDRDPSMTQHEQYGT